MPYSGWFLKENRGKMNKKFATILALASTFGIAAFAADREVKVQDRLTASADTLTDMMNASDHGIPHDLLDKARCIVVIPGMKKAGFIIGAKYGSGFASCRENGHWSAPAAMSVQGGSVGFQIGASDTDVIIVVMNDRGMNHLLEDKFTLGGEGSIAAGPVGRTASAETDAMMHAEMLSYSRSRGLFAGVSLEGATLHRDADTDHDLYGRDVTSKEILTGSVQAPADASAFETALRRDARQ
jgi:lipid-binding SYLF domain-containing protein